MMQSAAFLLQDDLRVAGDTRRKIGRQRERFVERIGVQRLRMAQHRRHRLDAGADHVVVDVLRGERPARGLAMGAQRQALVGFCAELFHEPRPQQARGAQLGHLHEEVHADGEEEGQARREVVDIEPGGDAGADIFHAVGERVAEFEIGGGAGLLHVVAGDRDRVEFRHMFAGVGENVRDDAHGGRWRIDIGVAHHEFFEDIVLDRAGEFVRRDALFFGGDDEQRQNRQHRAVHRHGHAHLVERNAVEQRPHVLDRVDRDARHADIARDARMIGIVAAMGREIEGDRQTFLAGREVAAIEGVGVFGGGEARVLADRPGLRDIHGWIGTAHKGRDAGETIDEAEACKILRAIEIFDLDAFRASATPRFGLGGRAAGAKAILVKSGMAAICSSGRRGAASGLKDLLEAPVLYPVHTSGGACGPRGKMRLGKL